MNKYRIVKSSVGFSVSVWHEEILKPNLIQKHFFNKRTQVVGSWELLSEIGWIYGSQWPVSISPPAIFNNLEEAEAFVERLNYKSEVVKEYNFE